MAQIEGESRRRALSKSDVVRERLLAGGGRCHNPAGLDCIIDLIGAVDGLTVSPGARKKKYLKPNGYGHERAR